MLEDLRIVWDYLAVTSTPRRSDALVCFGCLHLGVARRAAELYSTRIAPWVLVTGGTVEGLTAHQTEADAHAAVLRTAGVPDERIIIEREATNTGENISFGLRALAVRGIAVRRAVLVAWPSSLRRCVATLARHAPEIRVDTQPAFSDLGPYEATPMSAAAMALAELERLRTYPVLGYIAPVSIPARIARAAARLEHWSDAHRGADALTPAAQVSP